MKKLKKELDILLKKFSDDEYSKNYLFVKFYLFDQVKKLFFSKYMHDLENTNKKDISKVCIANYKPFNANMQCFDKKPITLIYGSNSIGKSSLIKSILYLREIRNTGNQNINSVDTFGDNIDFGGYYNSVHKHCIQDEIVFTIENSQGNEALVNLFGYSAKDVHTYNQLNKIEFEFNDEISFNFKLCVAYVFSTEMFEKDERLLDQSKWIWKNIKMNLSIDVSLLLIKFIKKYAFDNRDSLVKNEKVDLFAIENIPDQDIKEVFNDFMEYIVQYKSKNFPKELFSIASQKQRNFSASYRIAESNIDITYSIEDEELLKISLSDESYAEEFGRVVAGGHIIDDLKMNDAIVNTFEFRKHFLLFNILGNSSEDFYTLFDMKKYCVDYADREYGYDNSVDKDLEEVIEKLTDCPFIVSKENNNWFNFEGFNSKKEKKDQVIFIINKIIENMEERAGNEKYHYLGPLRYYPERYFDLTSEDSDVQSLSKDSWKKLFSKQGTVFTDNHLRDNINRWLSNDKLKTPYKIEIQKIYDDTMLLSQLKENEKYTKSELSDLIKKIEPIKEIVVFRDINKNTIVSHKDMGLGVSQVLPILINLFGDKREIEITETLMIEQPELHLHPAIQSELADEFISNANRRSNIIIETHSEHILLRMMKRMRQTVEGTLEDESLKLTPDDVCLLYIDSDGDNTYILELELDEDGSLLDPWPGGFFEESFNERFL